MITKLMNIVMIIACEIDITCNYAYGGGATLGEYVTVMNKTA